MLDQVTSLQRLFPLLLFIVEEGLQLHLIVRKINNYIYRMQSVLSKDSGHTIAFDSISSSPWFSTKQLQLSLSKCGAAAEPENTSEHCYSHAKQSDTPYQEQDSSSSLSSGQAHHEGATLARSNSNMQNISFRPGNCYIKVYGIMQNTRVLNQFLPFHRCV